ncbi:TIGR01621 family pseudouridine synthase [Alkalimonas amylolytica]|uniref:tRNA pseudouridine32 synthase / 23S rRNA pseudouridine746 synthase n=1 Tax=Alkalimonas amylolytica TaxID=152573 RepID=A0A1H3ZXT0_ALKAM|nr:TIGR01621 family pseudouridine synthase [Alkalimonas amylolytica]SEA28114.1 tRNA pseudouridine32 synthase / 23S rRNA pseudouridine746 synthase [Alkalimonas amylolytica]
MTEHFQIIANHVDWLALHKPAGVSFHSESEAGFVVQAEQQLGLKLYPVHRLDKLTSGVLLLAKSSQAAALFAEKFRQQQMEKYYLALSDRKPKRKQGWVKGDMTKARRGAWKLLASQQQPAVTYFISQGLAAQQADVPVVRAYLLKPWTGKTHQIRVALKSLGSPILGDTLYGGSQAERGYLHAYALCFDWHGQRIELHCAPQDGPEFLRLEDELAALWPRPWQLNWPSWLQPKENNHRGA